MKLGYLIADEIGVSKQSVLLLRHSNNDIAVLKKMNGSIKEYSTIQPSDTRYDFLANGKPIIQIAVVIVFDQIYSVYRIIGVAQKGTTRTLQCQENLKFEEFRARPERSAKQFSVECLESKALSKRVHGWTNFRCPVARFGNQLFETVGIN